MSEVGALIIKLQAETAQFREDMGKVKSDLDGLKDGSKDTGDAMDYSFAQARGSMMLTEGVLGVRLPRALNTLLAGIPAVGTVFAAMLPIVGVVAAIAIIEKAIAKIDEAKDKALGFGASWSEATSATVSKTGAMYVEILKLQDATAKLYGKPELNGPAIAAIEALDKINSMDSGILKAIGDIEKLMKEQNISTFDSLLTGKAGTGSIADALKPKLDTAKSLYAEVQNAESQLTLDTVSKMSKEKLAADAADIASKKAVAKSALDAVQTEVVAQQTLIQKQIEDREKMTSLDARRRGPVSPADIALMQQQHSLQNDILTGVQQQTRALQIDLGLETSLTAATKAHAAAQGDKDTKTKQEELLKYSQEIMKAFNATFKLDQEYVQLQEHIAAVNFKLLAADAEEAAKATEKMLKSGEMTPVDSVQAAVKDAQEKAKLAMQSAKDDEALHKKTAAQALTDEVAASEAETHAEAQAYIAQFNNLDRHGKDYIKKVQEIQNKIKEIEQKGASDVTALKKAAEQKQLQDIQQSENKMRETIATDVASSIVMNKNLALSFARTGEQMAEGMLKNLIMMELTHDKTRLINAKKAYGDSYTWAAAWGGPIAGAIAGALSFASVMAFEQGGKIPGAGAVPIVGHGGETVVTKALTDRVERAESSGMSAEMHMHNVFAPVIHAVDAEGVDRMLTKHNTVFQRHIASTMRRMNKG